jgi:hypothetical protein
VSVELEFLNEKAVAPLLARYDGLQAGYFRLIEAITVEP